jgi:hypothetical protein
MMTSRRLAIAAGAVSGFSFAFDWWFICWLMAMRRSTVDKFDIFIDCAHDHLSPLGLRRAMIQGWRDMGCSGKGMTSS